MSHQRSILRSLSAGTLALTLALSGCGNDDGDAADNPDSAETTETTSAGASTSDAAFTEFCASIVAADAASIAAQSQGGPPDPDAIAAAKEAINAVGDDAPDEIADDVATMIETGLASFESETGSPGDGFAEASGVVYGWVGENCGYHTLTTTAKDYSYEGMPTDLPAGVSLVTLDNVGAELHEMAFVRINDDVTETTEELLAMPEEEVMSKIEVKGNVFAMPGEEAHSTIDLPAGRYIVSCFIPVGLTPEAMQSEEMPEGPPHFTQGMVHEIQVG